MLLRVRQESAGWMPKLSVRPLSWIRHALAALGGNFQCFSIQSKEAGRAHTGLRYGFGRNPLRLGLDYVISM